MNRILAVSAALILGLSSSLAEAQSRAPSRPVVDTPELAKLGAWPVGVAETSILVGDVPQLLVSGQVTTVQRTIRARIWYPAAAGPNRPTAYLHEGPRIGGGVYRLTTPGIAVADARPAAHEKFPLVIVSHGLGGWDTAMTWLTENLASKGYVVVALDHADPGFHTVPEFLNALANVAMNRTSDQRAALHELVHRGRTEIHGWAALIDVRHIGLVGYSMGGFGALSTAGAGYDPASATLRKLPAEAVARISRPDPEAATLGALVAIAPWGAQPGERAWSPGELAKIHCPTLMIDGSRDEAVDYAHGVRWAFRQMTGTDRRLLVFEDAGHGVGGNPPPPAAADDADLADYFADPIWRTERLNGVSLHFITAFLDASLKGEAAKTAYLDVPTPLAAQGTWPQSMGDRTGPPYAGDRQPGYWRGFQRGLAVGLELYHLPKGSLEPSP